MRKNRFLILLVVQLIMLILSPFLEGFSFHRVILDGLLLLIFFSALYAVSDSRRPFFLVVALVALEIPVKLLAYLFPSHGRTLDIASNVITVVLLALAAGIILNYVLSKGRVDRERIFAALCVYLLMGSVFASVYMVVENVDPHAFKISIQASGGSGTKGEASGPGNRDVLFYFSFITLTTVGYGDVTPLSPPARTFALLEGIIGPLYLAVLIARLVGLQVADAGVEKEEKKGDP